MVIYLINAIWGGELLKNSKCRIYFTWMMTSAYIKEMRLKN